MSSNQPGSLFLFKSKIEEAVGLVNNMNPSIKLQAVNFWNLLSERLQDIVNHSAVDINNAIEIQRENDSMKDVFDSTAAQNEKDLNDNLESLIEENNEILKSNNLTNNQLQMFDNLNTNLNNDLTNNITNNLNSNLNNNMNSNMNSNMNNNMNNINNDLNTNMSNNQFINTNNELNLEDISNLTSNLELNEQDMINDNQMNDAQMNDQIDNQMKLNSTHSTNQTMHKEFDFDQFQRENNLIIRNRGNEKSNCDINLNNQNNKLHPFVSNLNSNDSGFMSCSPNGCVDNQLNNVINANGLTNDSTSNNLMNNNSVDMNNAYYLNQLNLSHSITNNHLINQMNGQQINDQLTNQMNNQANQNKNQSIQFTDNIRNSDDLTLIANLNDETNLISSATDFNLSNENENKNDNNKKKDKSIKSYNCDKCNNCFSTRGNLAVHYRKHTNERPFVCDNPSCNSSFSTKGNLKRHIKAHQGLKPFKCQICDSCFTEKKSLKVHFRRHTGERPYQCLECKKRFSQTGVLQTHMSLHSDVRKFVCTLCSKQFRQKSQLRLHIARHEGIKKYNCTNCSSKFLTKGDLQRHARTHSGERPFVCDLCSDHRTFTRQQSLNEHKNRFHFYLKPYHCNHVESNGKICDKRFVEMSSCYKHIKIHKKQQNQIADNITTLSHDSSENESRSSQMTQQPNTTN